MQNRLRSWLGSLPIDNALELRQAVLLQVMLLIILAGSGLGALLNILVIPMSAALVVSLLTYAILIGCMFGALWLLRRGRFRAAVALAISALVGVITLDLISVGVPAAASALLAFMLPLALAGLLLGRRGLLITGSVIAAATIVAGLLQEGAPSLIGFVDAPPANTASEVLTFLLIAAVFGLFLDGFGTSLHDALTATKMREQELERLRATLEETVAERTQTLQHALQAGEQREARLTSALDELHASQTTVRELSAPVIPVLPGVLVTPLIGVLDSGRAEALTSNVLAMVERENARQVIFDITGVPLVDTHVAQVLLQTTTAIRLLGAQTLLVGIRPEVAQTIVALGVDLSAIGSYATLQEAITQLLQQQQLV